ncbi:hypothetical protein [Mesobacillus zeae]|uniref:Lipoprotein n=1 Tax=Mesobacillus zeae TaxID=1917180 RepID=A0A398AV94_9BACI|nr:hypothetical protein [Mesobacillus zeae]RID81542.1 hypothetical protein D1970_21490 [Mesobacillus zeae]
MPNKRIAFAVAIPLLFAAGCNSEEVSKETDKAAQKTEQAAKKVQDKAKQVAGDVKEKTPGVIQNLKDTYKESEKKAKDKTLQKGEKATTQKEAYLALTPEAYDEVYQLIEVNDLIGVDKIEKADKVKKISKDTKVTIEKRDIRRTKVKTESGEEGYLPTSLLTPLKK